MARTPKMLRAGAALLTLLIGITLFGGCASKSATNDDTSYKKLQSDYAQLKRDYDAKESELRKANSELAIYKQSGDATAQRSAYLQNSVNELNIEVNALREALRKAEARQPETVIVEKPVEVIVEKTTTGFGGIEDVEVETSANEIALRMSSDVLFSPGKALLKSTSRKSLDQIISVLKKDYAGHVIRVEGYTDATPIKRSSWKDNLELSSHRAMSVQRYLKSKGVGNKMFSAGYGSLDPVADNGNSKGRAQNRRVEIVVLR